MPLALGDFDRLVPFMQFLVHFHRVFDTVVVKQDLLGPRKLLIEHGKPGLHLIEIDPVLPSCLLLVVVN